MFGGCSISQADTHLAPRIANPPPTPRVGGRFASTSIGGAVRPQGARIADAWTWTMRTWRGWQRWQWVDQVGFGLRARVGMLAGLPVPSLPCNAAPIGIHGEGKHLSRGERREITRCSGPAASRSTTAPRLPPVYSRACGIVIGLKDPFSCSIKHWKPVPPSPVSPRVPLIKGWGCCQ